MTVKARLDDNPGYKGSAHDDETAQAMGYRAALIPGAFVYGYFSRLAIEAWSTDWASHGSITVRFRKPVYNGDELTVDPQKATGDSDNRYAVTAFNQLGEMVADGEIALSAIAPEAPDVAGLPILPLPRPRPYFGAREMQVDARIASRDDVLSHEDVRISRKAFDERHPIYEEMGFVHSGCLMRRAMFDCNRSFEFPMPVIFVAVRAQHLRPVYPGQRVATSGRVTAVYERRGKHYFDSEEWLVVDGKDVAARFERTSIYATEPIV